MVSTWNASRAGQVLWTGVPMSLPPIHRVVTGHDAQGKAVVSSNGTLPTVVEIDAIPGTIFHEVWSTTGTPAPVDTSPDPTLGPLTLAPPRMGTRIRFVDIPPDTTDYLAHGSARMHDVLAQIGDAKASTVSAGAPHPLMHRTESVDYGIVIEGEMTLVLDDSEVLLKTGSVVVQRGTNHAWANRATRPGAPRSSPARRKVWVWRSCRHRRDVGQPGWRIRHRSQPRCRRKDHDLGRVQILRSLQNRRLVSRPRPPSGARWHRTHSCHRRSAPRNAASLRT